MKLTGGPRSAYLLLFLTGTANLMLAAASMILAAAGLALAPMAAAQEASCVNGSAGPYACDGVDLMARMPIPEIDADFSQDERATASVNDIWGWTDPQTGREYALVGRTDGVALVDISNQESPVYMANLPTHEPDSACGSQRDVKVYRNYAYVVAEVCPNGLQVFDLTRVRSITNPPVTLPEAGHYGRFADAHNVFIDTTTGYAYAVGISQSQNIPDDYPRPEACGSGLHIVNLQNPTNPQFAGCAMPSGYVHDTQCVIYSGPDTEYQGREICFSSSVEDVSITDVTNKVAPQNISTSTYPMANYVHQGWLAKGQRYFLQNDELDEENSAVSNTTTYIWDMQDLDAPELIGTFEWPTTSPDHNLYVRDDFALASNYTTGLRILDISDIHQPFQAGYFDTYPQNNKLEFDGSWSNYPFYESGIIAVSDISNGLFLLRPTIEGLDSDDPSPGIPNGFRISAPAPNPFHRETQITLTADQTQRVEVDIFDALGRHIKQLYDANAIAGEPVTVSFRPQSRASGTYFIRISSASFSDVVPIVYAK